MGIADAVYFDFDLFLEPPLMPAAEVDRVDRIWPRRACEFDRQTDGARVDARNAERANVQPWRIDACAAGFVFHDIVARVVCACCAERAFEGRCTDRGWALDGR